MSTQLKLPQSAYLTSEEEFKFLSYYEGRLRDFCRHFRPPLPPNVMATALVYFKRFYLTTSCMDYHPRYIKIFQIDQAEKYYLKYPHFPDMLDKKQQFLKLTPGIILISLSRNFKDFSIWHVCGWQLKLRSSTFR